MDRKKQLKEEYKSQKPEMGIFLIASDEEKAAYLEACKDLKGQMNSTQFKLNLGLHKNVALQKFWSQNDPQKLDIRIVEQLPCEEEDPDRDYQDDLEILKMECRQRLEMQYDTWID